MSKFATQHLNSILPYVPGEQPQVKMTKLNTNENPFAISANVRNAIVEQMDKLHLYPDPNSTRLKAAIAKYYGLSAIQVFVGNGSDEVLAHIFQAFFAGASKPILMPDITYSFYKVYAGLYAVEIQSVELRQDLSINIEDYQQECSGIIFPNPNAPSGRFLELEKIEKLLQNNKDKLVVIDEAYIDFGGTSCASLIHKYENLLVVQTFSKSRSLAGIRIGFAMANEAIIADLDKLKNSFNSYPVDRLGEAAAIAAIEDKNEFDKRTKQIIQWRLKLSTGLQELGFQVIPSQANFVFAKHEKVNGAYLLEELKKRNILVRNFSTPERIKDFLRISVGDAESIDILLQALQDILQN